MYVGCKPRCASCTFVRLSWENILPETLAYFPFLPDFKILLTHFDFTQGEKKKPFALKPKTVIALAHLET